MFGEGAAILDGYGGRSGGRQLRTLSRVRDQQEAEAEAPGRVATRWGLRRWVTQQPTKQEGRNKMLRHNEWRRRRRWAEAQQEGEAEAPGNTTTN